MISLVDVSKSYGGHTVLSKVNLALVAGQRLGLIGRNGTGKTTLLKILSGQLEPDSGHVASTPGVEVGYLGQEGQLSPEVSLYEEMNALFDRVRAMEAELRALEGEMATLSGSELKSVMDRYARLQAEYEHAEPQTIDARIRTVLAGMGFAQGDFDRPCREFSGGWQMRGALARLLLMAPSLLLLDEPTNHLDLEAVEWLEQYLSRYSGVVLLVSHDRTFLDRTVNKILELSGGELEEYAGNYSFYLEEKERRRELQEAAYHTQQRKLAQDERFIERFRYKATLASRVKSREKMLDKIERVELPEDEPRPMRLSFRPFPDSGREALQAKGLSKSYGPIQVLKGLSVLIERGERVAIVGPNGSGKSTLLRALAGHEPPDAGSIKHGHRLTPVFFAQHQAEALNGQLTVLEALEEVAPPNTDQTRLRTLLGCLLFVGDEVHKKVSVLSGGERSRVALARCIVRPSNLLFLDEPTNHLDLSAREALAEALQEYPGTIVLISHDRTFMDTLATRVVELQNGQAISHPGNYSDFQRRRRTPVKTAPELAEQNLKGRDLVPKGKRAPASPRQWSLPALEAKIFGIEEQIASLAEEMARPENGPRLRELEQNYQALTAECETLTKTWDELTG
ncbi:MAG: ABC transporter ATP-binding protein [Candidatus Xenobia bacterium]